MVGAGRPALIDPGHGPSGAGRLSPSARGGRRGGAGREGPGGGGRHMSPVTAGDALQVAAGHLSLFFVSRHELM